MWSFIFGFLCGLALIGTVAYFLARAGLKHSSEAVSMGEIYDAAKEELSKITAEPVAGQEFVGWEQDEKDFDSEPYPVLYRYEKEPPEVVQTGQLRIVKVRVLDKDEYERLEGLKQQDVDWNLVQRRGCKGGCCDKGPVLKRKLPAPIDLNTFKVDTLKEG